MLATQTAIDTLADRIERAYRLRRPEWHGMCSTHRVWTAAATALLNIHGKHPAVPVDPELFVAAQPADATYPDPWLELTQADAVRRYLRRVRSIVRRLRTELAGEVRLAEGRIGAGEAIGKVLSVSNRRLSALGRFIVAQRAGRVALASRFVDDAVIQHWACPLYRQACADLLSDGSYPVPDAATESPAAPKPVKGRSRTQVHLN